MTVARLSYLISVILGFADNNVISSVHVHLYKQILAFLMRVNVYISVSGSR